jgi:hypothetical protein
MNKFLIIAMLAVTIVALSNAFPHFPKLGGSGSPSSEHPHHKGKKSSSSSSSSEGGGNIFEALEGKGQGKGGFLQKIEHGIEKGAGLFKKLQGGLSMITSLGGGGLGSLLG